MPTDHACGEEVPALNYLKSMVKDILKSPQPIDERDQAIQELYAAYQEFDTLINSCSERISRCPPSSEGAIYAKAAINNAYLQFAIGQPMNICCLQLKRDFEALSTRVRKTKVITSALSLFFSQNSTLGIFKDCIAILAKSGQLPKEGERSVTEKTQAVALKVAL